MENKTVNLCDLKEGMKIITKTGCKLEVSEIKPFKGDKVAVCHVLDNDLNRTTDSRFTDVPFVHEAPRDDEGQLIIQTSGLFSSFFSAELI